MFFLKKILHTNNLPTYTDKQIVAVTDARVIPLTEIEDPAFANETMGQTIALDITNGEIVSPANGKLEVMFPTGHAFAVRMMDGTVLMVHIGIDTVDLNGNGFKILARQGDMVKAGQKIVSVNLDTLRQAGRSTITMIIVTNPATSGQREDFVPVETVVCSGQIINHR
jgi:glucose-specific phosphotransferase system IIA component